MVVVLMDLGVAKIPASLTRQRHTMVPLVKQNHIYCALLIPLVEFRVHVYAAQTVSPLTGLWLPQCIKKDLHGHV
jgi:hypothetical protein